MTRLQKAIDLINSNAITERDGKYFVKQYEVTVQPSTSPEHSTYTCTCVFGAHDQRLLLSWACSHGLALAGYLDIPVVIPPI